MYPSVSRLGAATGLPSTLSVPAFAADRCVWADGTDSTAAANGLGWDADGYKHY